MLDALGRTWWYKLSMAEADPERADSYRLSADHTPYSWTASPFWRRSQVVHLYLPKWMIPPDIWMGLYNLWHFRYLLAHLLLAIQIWTWCVVADSVAVQDICCSSLWKDYFLPYWHQAQSCDLCWPVRYEWKWWASLLSKSFKSRDMCCHLLFFSPSAKSPGCPTQELLLQFLSKGSGAKTAGAPQWTWMWVS